MTALVRFAVIRLLPVSVRFGLPAISEAQEPPRTAEQIDKAYGLDSFGQVATPSETSARFARAIDCHVS